MRYVLLSLALSGLLSAACSAPSVPASDRPSPAPSPSAPMPSAPAHAPQTPAQERASVKSPRQDLQADEFLISMRRGACFGRCPQYTVTIDAQGTVTFEGQRFVSALGTRTGSADGAAVARLQRKASAVFSTITDVVPGAAGCRNNVTDQPQITLELAGAEGTRTLRHYTGCRSAPSALIELEQQIDRTADVAQWVTGRALQ